MEEFSYSGIYGIYCDMQSHISLEAMPYGIPPTAPAYVLTAPLCRRTRTPIQLAREIASGLKAQQ
jgi:hypothetical protein